MSDHGTLTSPEPIVRADARLDRRQLDEPGKTCLPADAHRNRAALDCFGFWPETSDERPETVF